MSNDENDEEQKWFIRGSKVVCKNETQLKVDISDPTERRTVKDTINSIILQGVE